MPSYCNDSVELTIIYPVFLYLLFDYLYVCIQLGNNPMGPVGAVAIVTAIHNDRSVLKKLDMVVSAMFK